MRQRTVPVSGPSVLADCVGVIGIIDIMEIVSGWSCLVWIIAMVNLFGFRVSFAKILLGCLVVFCLPFACFL